MSHARHESVARMRRPTGSSPVKARNSPLLPDSPAFSSPIPDAFHSLSQRQRRSVLTKAALVLAALGGFVYVVSGFLDGQSVQRLVTHRKLQLEQGESWILPKRWRDQQKGTAIDGETLPDCTRVLLFKFSNDGGFSSEINHIVRASVIAQKTGFTLLADDSEWTFGSLRDYFLPRQIYCRPPLDWFVQDKAVALGTRKWQSAKRVWYSRQLAPAADRWIREETLDPVAVDKLHSQAFGHILTEGETLPPALEDVFVDFHAALKEIWRPNGQLSTLIRRQRIELGLGEGGLRQRKNSPTWGGRAKAKAAADEEVEADDDSDEFADSPGHERGDRGPIVGLHVPLSDKKSRWESDMAEVAVTGQSYSNISVLVEGAGDAVRRLSKSSIAEPGYSRAQSSFRSEAQTSLLVMTSESSALSALAASPLTQSYTLQRTSPPSEEHLRQWKDLLKAEGEETVESGEGSILSSWRQSKFDKLPRGLRVQLTRHFLRDLTTLSLHADAFVVRGTSNVGRLAAMIGGEDAVIGPRDISGHGLGGRIRSVDAPWYPTSQLSALYQQQ